jgi:hypothetical protein
MSKQFVDANNDKTGHLFRHRVSPPEHGVESAPKKRKYKYVNFSIHGGSWCCFTNRGNTQLGFLEWNPKWKQFEYVPEERTAYTQDCLTDISHFMRQLEDEKRTNNSSLP